jgi:integrase
LLSYKHALEGRVIPRIGALEPRQIAPKHVTDLYAELLTDGGLDERRGKALSARTVNYTGKVLTRVLDDAVRLGYLNTNPAKLVERPKAREVEMKVWSASESRTFLGHVANDRLYPLWVLYLTSGLRRGEALGLRWQDIDLDAGRLAVRRTLVAVGGKPAFSTPKTERSRRVVALDEGTVAVLRAHRTRQLEERLAIGPGYQDDGLVFCTVSGAVLHPDNVTNTFDRQVKAAKLPRIRLHDLRHTAATLLLEAGVPLKVVSERFGHSSIAITGDLYQHVTEHMQTDAAEKAGRALLG